VVPVVIGARCASDALIFTPSRDFGAGFGTGTVCADNGRASAVATAATSTPVTMERPREDADSTDRTLEILSNASSCLDLN
jgi:hypothetical protein